MKPDSGDLDPDEVVSMAEEFLESQGSRPDRGQREALKKNLDEWRRKMDETDEGDPLYNHVEQKYQEHKDRWNEQFGEVDESKREFLEVVSNRYVAEGFWINDTVIRALNLMLFGKLNDTLVVERKIISEDSDFDDEKLFDVSKRIRDLAEEELELMGNLDM